MGVDISNPTWTQNPSTIPDMSKVAELMATYLLDLLVISKLSKELSCGWRWRLTTGLPKRVDVRWNGERTWEKKEKLGCIIGDFGCRPHVHLRILPDVIGFNATWLINLLVNGVGKIVVQKYVRPRIRQFLGCWKKHQNQITNRLYSSGIIHLRLVGFHEERIEDILISCTNEIWQCGIHGFRRTIAERHLMASTNGTLFWVLSISPLGC